jgi:hypothetical protein
MPRCQGGAVADVDQEQGEVRRRRAGQHVAGILLVARRVGDHEGATRRGEIAVGDIDRDALLAFGFKAVEQERILELARNGAVSARQDRQFLQLVVGDRAGLDQQAADQGGLAVVHRAARDDVQLIAVAYLPSGGLHDRRVHQK